VVKGSGPTILEASIKMAFRLFAANRSLREARDGLEAAATRYGTILSTAMDAYWLIDLQGRILEVNDSAGAMLGYPVGALAGMDVADLDAFQRKEDIRENFSTIAERHAARFETRHRRRDGGVIDVEVSTTYLPLEGGRVVSFIRDITDKKRAEAALRNSEARFRSLFDNDFSRNSLYEVLLDDRGEPASYRCLAVNQALEKFLGKPASELVGRPLGEIFPRLDPLLLERLATAFRSGGPLRFEHYNDARGTYSEVCIFVPQPGQVAVSSFDITERKRAEQALETSEEKHHRLVENSHDIIYTLTAEGVFTFVSPAWTALLGHRVEEVVGTSYAGYIHPEDLDACRAWVREVIQTGERQEEIEYRARALDGSWRWHSSNAVPLRDAKGAVIGFQGIARDIQERKSMEALLASKREELDLYFSSALDLLCIADVEGRFLRLNPEWEKVLGYPLAELEGRIFLDFVHPDDLEGTLAAISELGAQREVLSFENRYRCKDGSWRWIEWRSKPRGSLIYAVARDVTDRKRAEEEVRSLLAEKELILREVHHRLKNNLNSIGDFLDLQGAAAADGASREVLNKASLRVRSMLLLYDKLYKSAGILRLSVADYIPELVDRVTANFALAASIEVRKDIEAFELEAKILQPLGIIVNELLTNAMKYAFVGRRAGSLAVTARAEGGRAVLTVEDDGVGLPDSVSLDRPSGFGLTLVAELSAQIRGRARLERGRGTRIVLEFPI
jgi:PAS domain S-box-containing protein